MINNRQGNNNRRRGRNNNNQRPQNGGQGRNGDNGNRIDNRARGNAPQLLEKYRGLARDAQMAGDRVLTEYYHQFADHYFRVVQETRARYEDNRRPREEWDANDSDEGAADARPNFDDGDDDDFADEPRRERAPVTAERQALNGERQPRAPRFADADEGEESDAGAEPGGERTSRWEQRIGNSQRQERRPREERAGRDERGARRARFGSTDAAPEADSNDAAADAPLTLDLTVLPPAIAPASGADAADMAEASSDAAPKRRGRPRKVAAEAEAE